MTYRLGLLAIVLPACAATDVSVGALARDAGRDAAPPEPDAAPPEPAAQFPYIEAEQGALSGGFQTARDDTASQGAYLLAPDDVEHDDAPGPARAVYRIAIPRDGEYRIWGRIRAPDATRNRFWFQLDDAPFRKWRISVGDIWYWDDFHDDRDYGNALLFPLTAGEHTLTLASCAYGVALDRLYVTADGDVPPGNDTPCAPPHSIEVAGVCLPSCGAQRGRMCGAANCAGFPLIDAYDCDVCCEGPPQD